MTKLELWDYMRNNPNSWHKASELREKFGIKQQATLKDWTDVPFIGSYGNNKGKSYKFLTNQQDKYEEFMRIEMNITDKVLPTKGKELPVPLELLDEKYTLRFPFAKGNLMAVAKSNMKGIAGLGDEFAWVKEAVLSVESNRLTPGYKAVVEALIVSLHTIVEFNGYDYSEEMEALRKSLRPESVEEIRQAELDDVVRHLPVKKPPIDYSQMPEEWFGEQ